MKTLTAVNQRCGAVLSDQLSKGQGESNGAARTKWTNTTAESESKEQAMEKIEDWGKPVERKGVSYRH